MSNDRSFSHRFFFLYNFPILFNGDIADNAEFVSLFFNQFILRWNYVLYKRYKVNQSKILPDEEVKAYEKIRDQQIDRLNKTTKLFIDKSDLKSSLNKSLTILFICF